MKKAILLLTLLSIQVQAKTIYRSKILKLSVKEKKAETIIRFSDEVMHPLYLELQELKEKLSKDKNVVFRLDSGGGDIVEGRKVISFIKNLKAEGFHVVTRVLNGRMCGSMCVPIFMAADNREASHTSAFMFHAVHGALDNTPKKRETKELFDEMKAMGMNQEFIDYLYEENALTIPGEFWLSAKELSEIGSGVVTKLLPRHKKIKLKRRATFIPKL